MTGPLLQVNGLRKYFAVRNVIGMRVNWLKALDDVSFEVQQGEVLGLVGESGCGKSTLGKTLIGVHKPIAGQVHFQDREIGNLVGSARRAVGKTLQYVYQDPGASLDPRWKIKTSLHEPLIIHTDLDAAQRETRVEEVLHAVGLPMTHLDLYPHELSGGQQRRVGLARILTLQPSMVILDEPTSGLDVSVQATVLKLFKELQQRFNLTYLFISHDLNVVNVMCHRVAVMYLGKIIEIGATEQVFQRPQHPYTQLLLSAIPEIGGRRFTMDLAVKGEPPDPINMPSGCRFRNRCPRSEAICAEQEPVLKPTDGDRSAACHFT